MTREEKQKAVDALKISAPVMAVTQEEFNDYIQTLNKIMDWLEQEPCDDWYDVPSDEMTLDQARQAVKDLRKKWAEYLEQEPSDTVSRGVFEQVMRERDIAIEQLHELGYELGQKIEPCDDAVSRQAAIDAIKKIHPVDTEYDCTLYDKLDVMYVLKELPPIIPQQKVELYEDAVSRDMALEKMADYVASGYADSAEDFEEYSKIICQLSSVNPQAKEQEPCDEAISRQAVLDEIDDTNRRGGFGCKLSYTRCRGHIEQLPSATQKSGKWLYKEITDDYRVTGQCSECRERRIIDNFCPNCGCRMVEPQESEE